MHCRLCTLQVRIRQWVREIIRRISNLLKMFEVRTLSNSNSNFVTSLVTTVSAGANDSDNNALTISVTASTGVSNGDSDSTGTTKSTRACKSTDVIASTDML